MKDSDLDASQSGAFNPYRLLMTKLIGGRINAPRARSAANTWRKTQRECIDAEAKRLAEEMEKVPLKEGEKRESMVTIRDRVARDMFGKLSKGEQNEWKKTAAQEHRVAEAAWKAEMEAKPATDPKSRQM